MCRGVNASTSYLARKSDRRRDNVARPRPVPTNEAEPSGALTANSMSSAKQRTVARRSLAAHETWMASRTAVSVAFMRASSRWQRRRGSLTDGRDLGAPLIPLVAILCQLAWLEYNPAAPAAASKNPWRPRGGQAPTLTPANLNDRWPQRRRAPIGHDRPAVRTPVYSAIPPLASRGSRAHTGTTLRRVNFLLNVEAIALCPRSRVLPRVQPGP